MKKIYLLFFLSIFFSSCSDSAFNSEERRKQFEKELSFFIGKGMDDFRGEFMDWETKEANVTDYQGNDIFYKIFSDSYTFGGKKYTCEIRFRFERVIDKSKKTSTLVVDNFDYKGDGCY